MKYNKANYFKKIPLIVALSAVSFNVHALPATGISFVDSGQAMGSGVTVRTDLVDIDGDGDLDALTANYGQGNLVWINDGNGTFTDSGQSLGTNADWGICTGDIDTDGDLDVGYANWNNSQGSNIYKNDGTGLLTKTAQALYPLQAAGNCELGDLDGDGDLDLFLFVGAYTAHGDRVFLNDGTGSFTDTNQVLDGGHSYGGVLSDLDGDGDLDAVSANASAGQANSIYINDGTGTFTDSGQSAGTEASWSVIAADIDADGDNDLIVTDWSGSSRIHLNDGSAVFTPGQALVVSNATGVAAGDLDGDGDLDLVFASYNSANKVFENDGTGNFTDTGLSLGASMSGGVTLADIDGDGDLDIYESVYDGTKQNKVWLNGSKGVVQFSSATYSASETDGSITITVSRSNGATGAATIDYATTDGTATSPSDYTVASGTLSWNDGETGAKTFIINVSSDTETETDETINLTLSNAVGAGLGVQTSATLTLQNVVAVVESDTNQESDNATNAEGDDGFFGVGSFDSFSLLMLSLLSMFMLRIRKAA